MAARLAQVEDLLDIEQLVQVFPWITELFGDIDIGRMLETANLALSFINDEEEIVGGVFLLDYPNVPSVDPAVWEKWLTDNYSCTEEVSPMNTLFLHLFVAMEYEFKNIFMEVMYTSFLVMPHLEYVLLTVPKSVPLNSTFCKFFEKSWSSTSEVPYVVYITYRHNYMPLLKIRNARVEDHDDLFPVFAEQNDTLYKVYGPYYLAELVEAQGNTYHSIVAEVNGHAVGLMSITKNVNLELLNDCFELIPYHGLHKYHPDDNLESQSFPLEYVHLDSEVPYHPGEDFPAHVEEQVTEDTSEKLPESAVKSESPWKSQDGAESTTSKSTVASSSVPWVRRLSDSRPKSSTQEFGIHSREELQSNDSPRFQSPRLPHPVERTSAVYHGETNAFCIQLFCISEGYKTRCTEFLSRAFLLYPDCDYCVLSVPHLVPDVPFLSSFTRVTPSPTSTFPQELYIFHKAGLLRNMKVMWACEEDTEGIKFLVNNLVGGDIIFKDFHKSVSGHENTMTFVAKCLEHIVGVATVRPELDLLYLRSHYNIEGFVDFAQHEDIEHGHLYHCILNPVFQRHSNFFLKEILRQAHMNCLYYPLYPQHTDSQEITKHTLITVLDDLVPVKARRQIVYPFSEIGENAPVQDVLKKMPAFALYHVNRTLTGVTVVTINARLVVIGASDTSLVFLETLTFCTGLRFNNLTLVSPHGIPGDLPPDEIRDAMFPSTHCYSKDDLHTMSLRTWVNKVYGTMVAINREDKYIIVNGDTAVPYDYLFLCCGQQFLVCSPLEVMGATDENRGNASQAKSPSGMKPANLFLVNSEFAAASALYWLQTMLLEAQDRKDPVLVYGCCLEVYCCISVLLKIGIPPEQIILLQSLHSYCNDPVASLFKNRKLMRAILQSVEESGVKVYEECTLTKCWLHAESGEVQAASFKTGSSNREIPCAAIFMYAKKNVSIETFKAINNASIVFDGHLVIDPEFQTNDEYIRAAGPMTKYSRKHYSEDSLHCFYNPKEIGTQLAETIIKLLDPIMEQNEQVMDTNDPKLVPKYKQPIIRSASLPGGWNLLHINKPGQNQLKNLTNHEGYEFITAYGDSEGPGFFRLYLNKYRCVESITCFTKQTIETENLINLYGLHEQLLNDLVARFHEGLVPDLLAYFRQPWCLALFHDRLSALRQEIRELFSMPQNENGLSFAEEIKNMIDEEEPDKLTALQEQKLWKIFKDVGLKTAIEYKLSSFLAYNDYHLPMYAKPDISSEPPANEN